MAIFRIIKSIINNLLSHIPMAQIYKKVGQNLFCGDFVMEGALHHTNQFLKKLNEEVDFEKLWHEKLIRTYKGHAEMGQPPYRPALILKMLFLAYLFNQSEREIERVINDSISMKVFLGLALDEGAPDHSSLTKFKNRILGYQLFHGEDIFKELFDEVILHAQEQGIELGYTQSIDSTHTIADVNTRKDQKRQKQPSDGGEGKFPRDPDAKWGVKRTHEVKTTTGGKVKVNESYFAYKSHLSTNTKTNLVTSYMVTAMNEYDGKYFEPLMRDDLKKGVAKRHRTIYTADRGYDDGENHAWLNQERFKDAIALKYVKDKTPEGKTKARWTMFTTQEEFEAGLSERYVVERVNASLKKYHTLERARYLGLAKMSIQTALSCIAHNLKTLVKVWTGIGLRMPATVHVS